MEIIAGVNTLDVTMIKKVEIPFAFNCSWSGVSKWGSAMPSQKCFLYSDMVVGPPFYSTEANPDWIPGQPTYSGNPAYLKYFIQAARVNGGLAMPYLTLQWSIFTKIIANSLTTFVANTVNLVTTNFGTTNAPFYFDGVFLDPEGGQDASSMAKVVKALADALHPLGKYVGVTFHYGQQNSWGMDIPVADFNSYCDFAIPMAYDLGGYPNSNRPILANTISCWQKVLNAGYTPSKIIGGLPFYGQPDSAQGADATYAAAAAKGYTVSPDADFFTGTFPYNNKNITGDWYYGAPGPKVQWAASHGMGGVFIFSVEYDLDYDDSRSLLAAMVKARGGTTTHQLSISVSGSGTTSPAAGVYTYNDGEQVTLTANPASGWLFDHWSNGSTSPSITLTMNTDISITAVFVQSGGYTYYLSVAIAGYGSVSIKDRSSGIIIGTLNQSGAIGYNSAVQVQPIASPSAGYSFSYWVLDGKQYTSLTSFTFGNRTLQAVFI